MGSFPEAWNDPRLFAALKVEGNKQFMKEADFQPDTKDIWDKY